MNRRWQISIILAVLVIASSTYGQRQAADASAAAADQKQDYQLLINRYCVLCHNQKANIAGLQLDKADLGKIAEQAQIWEKVQRKLRAGLMPPQGMPRPDETKLDAFVSMLEQTLDQAALAKPDPGPALVRRLTRTEYGNAVRDLLGLDVDVASMLPGDGYSNEGFDNDAAALGVSPLLAERYLSAASKLAGLAVGSMSTSSAVNIFRPRPDLSQDSTIEGMPVETRGGVLAHYIFPVDGEYVFKSTLWKNDGERVRGLELPTEFEVTLDGRRIHLVQIGGGKDEAYAFNAHVAARATLEKRMETSAFVKAGPHDVGFAFLKKSSAVPIDMIQPLQRENLDNHTNTGLPTLTGGIIVGPLKPVAPGDTPSRRRIFICDPSSDDRDSQACATRILTRLARLAYRRPATKSEMAQLFRLFELGRSQGGGDAGIEAALSYILASPKFVFRAEKDPTNLVPGATFRVDDYDLASRLSFFIWSSIPDDELLNLAGEGKLKDRAVLSQQVARMLKDPKSSAMVTNFADQWLRLRNLKVTVPNDLLFPDFDDNLRQGFQRETELFFDSIVRENRNVLDLLNADYTFVNERLAANYGIPNVNGSEFRRVTINDENRRGLLGQGSILAVTSYGNRTSPVVRGKFVLSIFLGNPPPPPPPNVPALVDTSDPDKPLTMRQRMEAHRENPACAGCHRLMDPIGFSMENFDAIGRFRTSEENVPIDASGVMADGSKLDGPASLRRAILSHPQLFVRTVTEALLTYALGRSLGPYDMPAVRAIVRDAASENYTFASLVQGIVKSPAFQLKVKEPTAAPEAPVVTAQGISLKSPILASNGSH